MKYNQPAAARRGEVPRAPVHFSGHFIYQIIKQTDTKNIGKGLFYPQITIKLMYYGEEKPQPSAMLLHSG
ncbi:MAG TPA: hypothetical protein H9677_03620 [Firmicutes bacterium]|nr:hypothetical protein [Bacillota bacterium]